MVKLIDDYSEKAGGFEAAGIKVPSFDQLEIAAKTEKNPLWVHFGGGNLFRCFHAAIAQELIDKRLMDSGVVVAETYDDEVITKAYTPFDNRFLAVTMKADGTFDKELIAAVTESIYFSAVDGSHEDWDRLVGIFANPSLQLVTLSITEKGYSLRDLRGDFTEAVKADLVGDDKPQTSMAIITYLLYQRYRAGKFPIAVVSTDNFSQNGKKLQEAVMTIARGWCENDKVEQGFVDYLEDSQKVTFPWTMIDRITPAPAQSVADLLEKDGFEDTEIIHTSKHSIIAPFGNTEEAHYLVVEDSFPNGRPPLEQAGVILTDRETVNDADQMKVTACLNPLHTALAIFGCVLGFKSIADEAADPLLLGLIENLGYGEDLPVVKDPGIIHPQDFIDQLLTKRLPNKNTPDTPQRIATDSSQKIPVRFGVTIGHYIADPRFDVKDLEFIPLVFAGWCRYLMGVTDDLEAFTPSPDPLLDELQAYVSNVQIGADAINQDIHGILKPILGNHEIFPYDLYGIGLAGKVERYFAQMVTGKGAVKTTLKKALEEHGKKF
jgi:fructuronate reductase